MGRHVARLAGTSWRRFNHARPEVVPGRPQVRGRLVWPQVLGRLVWPQVGTCCYLESGTRQVSVPAPWSFDRQPRLPIFFPFFFPSRSTASRATASRADSTCRLPRWSQRRAVQTRFPRFTVHLALHTRPLITSQAVSTYIWARTPARAAESRTSLAAVSHCKVQSRRF